MTLRADGSAKVYPGHDLTAEDGPEDVGVLREYVLGHVRDRRGAGLRRERSHMDARIHAG